MQAQVGKKIITKEVLTKVEEEVTTVTLTLSLDEAKLLRTSAYAVAIYGAVKNGSVCNLMGDIHKGLIASGVPACERIFQVVDQVKYSGKEVMDKEFKFKFDIFDSYEGIAGFKRSLKTAAKEGLIYWDEVPFLLHQSSDEMLIVSNVPLTEQLISQAYEVLKSHYEGEDDGAIDALFLGNS